MLFLKNFYIIYRMAYFHSNNHSQTAPAAQQTPNNDHSHLLSAATRPHGTLRSEHGRLLSAAIRTQRASRHEHGYTLQTLTITAVLLLLAVLSATIIMSLVQGQRQNTQANVPIFDNPLDTVPGRSGRAAASERPGTLPESEAPAASPLPHVSIQGGQATEGTPVEFSLHLSQESANEVRLAYSVADGSAKRGAHYEVSQQTIASIPAGSIQAPLQITTLGPDGVNSGDKAFTVQLTAVTSDNAQLDNSNAIATGIIREHDQAEPPPGAPDLPMVSVSDAAPVTEGSDLTFRVELDQPAAENLKVFYQTEPGTSLAQWHLALQPSGIDEETKQENFCSYSEDVDGQHSNGIGAVAGTDFTARPAGSFVTIQAGSRSADITVETIDDAIEQYRHGLKVSLDLARTRSHGANLASAPGGTQAIGIITDNEPRPSYTVQPEADIAENTGRFDVTVLQSGESERCYAVEVSYTQNPAGVIEEHSPLNDGAAGTWGRAGQNAYANVNPADWNLSFDMSNITAAIFPAGETRSRKAVVDICHDSFVEPDETFEVFPTASYRTVNFRRNGRVSSTQALYNYSQATAATFTIKDASDPNLPTVKAAQRSIAANDGDRATILLEFSAPLPAAAKFLVQAEGNDDAGLVWEGDMAGYRLGSYRVITAAAGSQSVELSFTVANASSQSFDLRLRDVYCQPSSELPAPTVRPVPTFTDPDNPSNGLVGLTVNINQSAG